MTMRSLWVAETARLREEVRPENSLEAASGIVHLDLAVCAAGHVQLGLGLAGVEPDSVGLVERAGLALLAAIGTYVLSRFGVSVYVVLA